MNETTVTVIGRLGGDPELRFTPSGAAVCNFSIGTNARTYDKQAQEWKDGPTTWYKCAAWRDMAENVAESLQRGDGVVVVGHLSTRTYETRDGQERLSVEIDVQHVGPDLRWSTAKVTRAQRRGEQQGGGGWNPQTQGHRPQKQQADDPWGTPAQRGQQTSQGGDPWARPGTANDEPPFR